MLAPDGTIRPAYRRLHESLATARPADLTAPSEALDRALVDQGITFSLSGQERPFPLDLEAREGVCQDYAHLTLAMLRAIGVPSRYVSGYLHTRADGQVGETVRGESHAWIEAWTGGWWGFDPTSDVEIGPRYIRVAMARDYADVSPLKGTYTGGAASAIEVSVEVTRLA